MRKKIRKEERHFPPGDHILRYTHGANKMKTLYLDCFSGISGDMCLSALLDLGVPADVLKKVIEQLQLPVTLEIHSVKKNSLRATSITVREKEPQPCSRTLKQLMAVLEAGRLPAPIRSQVDTCLHRLATAEASVHGTAIEEVHFHEVGGLYTLVDLAGTFAGISYLEIDQVFSSPLPLGRGAIKTAHGIIPTPAPATMELLQGKPTYGIPFEGELITPTGAALVTTLASSFGPPPPARWMRVGYGAGSQDFSWPNILRAWLGEADDTLFDEDQTVVLETQVDDTNPEFLPYLRSRLEEAGALDVLFTPAIMKKGRPGTVITALSPQTQVYSLVNIIFQETTTLGVRWHRAGRIKLHHEIQEVNTVHGKIRLKVGYGYNQAGEKVIYNMAPEYEDCAQAAKDKGVAIKDVYQAVMKACKIDTQRP
jgi:uncharacterized protein (TIGR00299 family) protein